LVLIGDIRAKSLADATTPLFVLLMLPFHLDQGGDVVSASSLRVYPSVVDAA
jgi:hypothetical protein